jgi:rhodanese-related sulfurtransferase
MQHTTKLSGKDFLDTYIHTPHAVCIDVRTKGEFLTGHIEGAMCIDIQDPSFLSEIQKLDTSKTYFVYCRSGNRSGHAVVIMKSIGFEHLYDLDGGIMSLAK